MRTLSTMLNTFGGCMLVLSIFGLAAERDAIFFTFVSIAAVAFLGGWWASRRGSAIIGAGEAQATSETRACGYCTSEIPASALRCPKCSGEFRHCPRCKELVAVSTRQKTVGLARGGRTPVADCLRCGKQITGPLF